MKRDEVFFVNVFAFLGAVIVLLLSSCKAVSVPVEVHKDSTLVQFRTDSVYIYNRDSIFIKEKGDTVFLERWSIRYRDKVVKDTVQVSSTKEVPVEVKVPTRYIPSWVWYLVGFNVLALLLFVARVAYKIYFRK